MHKFVPKSYKKKKKSFDFWKSVPEDPKIWGGGLRPVFDKVKIKAVFFWESSLM